MRQFLVLVSSIFLLNAPVAATQVKILSEDESGITIEFTTTAPMVDRMNPTSLGQLSRITISGMNLDRIEGLPVLPVRRFFIEVPAGDGIRLQVLDAQSAVLEGVVPEVWFQEKADIESHIQALSTPNPQDSYGHAELVGIHRMRGRTLVFIDLCPVVWDAASLQLIYSESIVVRLSFPPSRGTGGKIRRRAGGGDYLLYDKVAGVDLPVPVEGVTSARTPFEFSMSSNWLKMGVSTSGMHVVTYTDLMNAGVNPLTIDPATIRVFTAGPLQQPDLIDDGGSFQEEYHLKEVSVLYDGDQPDVFSSTGRLVFYAVGVRGWKNVLDPMAEWTDRYEHDYADESVYWMSWGGDFPGAAARVTSRNVTPVTPTPDLEISSYEARIRYEEDNLYDPWYTEDDWYWRMLGTSSSSFTNQFYLSALSNPSGRLRTIGYGPYRVSYYDSSGAYYSINGSDSHLLKWYIASRQFNPQTLDVQVDDLVNGLNTFRITREGNSNVYLMWYDLFFERDLVAVSGQLDFFSPEQGAAATSLFSLSGFSAGDQQYLFDVTDKDAPINLSGFNGGTTGNIEFEDLIGGGRTHYSACSSGNLVHPSIELAYASSGGLISLRDEPGAPHMVIIYAAEFEDAATRLASYRSDRLPGVDAPLVKAVRLEQVFDNFSGGMRDPVAVRNYFKYLYDTFIEEGEPVLQYVLLMGNGIYDTKDILGTGNDKIPLYMKKYFHDVVEDDDFFARLDEGTDLLTDLSIGRMTVLTADEAMGMVNSIIDYESGNDKGTWRNQVILIADDEFSANTDCDFSFIRDTEYMTLFTDYFPEFLDINKVYLHEYPFSGSLKPAAASDLQKLWNAGALLVNYTGHGSPQQMADEVVMQKADVYSLRNGNKKPVFLAFSCSVGDIESPYQRSISQELLVRDNGGAIATVTGTGGTYGPQNRVLSYALFDLLFTTGYDTETLPIGKALMLAKPSSDSWPENAAKYILLGDPALSLAVPEYVVEHETTQIDTLYTGTRYRIEGRVTSDGVTVSSFNGSADILVQDSSNWVEEEITSCNYLYYDLEYAIPGKAIFRGSVDVSGGTFSADFVVPVRCKAGGDARVRSYVQGNGPGDGVGAVDSIMIINNPDPVVNEGPPSINIFFEGQANKVKQGAILNVEITDPDGIAILGSDPQSSIFLEFDNSGYPIFVTDYFSYDHGSYTTGRVEYPLHSGFSPGAHSVIVRAFDNLGESSTDTLSFDVVEEGLYTVSDVFNMPNPFTESTNFIFQLSSEADVILRLYNVSGREIWQKRMSADEGFNSIFWDGRDYGGDRPANGTYLYILDVSFRNSFNRSEKVTGKAVLLK